MTDSPSTHSIAANTFIVSKMSTSTISTTLLSINSLIKNNYLMIRLLQHAQQSILTTNILFHQLSILHNLLEIL